MIELVPIKDGYGSYILLTLAEAKRLYRSLVYFKELKDNYLGYVNFHWTASTNTTEIAFYPVTYNGQQLVLTE